jgi:hypothetical protein
LAGPGLASLVSRYSRYLEIFRIVAAITLQLSSPTAGGVHAPTSTAAFGQ